MKSTANNSKRIILLIVLLLLCILAAVYIINIGRSRMQEAREKEIEQEIAAAEQEAAEDAAEAEEETEAEDEISRASDRIYSYRGSSDDEAFTMAAYDHAIEAGSAFIAAPFVVSGDGTLYVADDDDSTSLTGYSGYFSGMSDAQIAELDTRGGSKLIKLSDLFDKYGRSVNYIIELKYTSPRNIQALEDLIKKYELESNTAISSMYFTGLKTLDADMPDITKIFLCSNDEEFGEAIGLDQVDTVSVKKDLMIEDYCKMAHDRGKKFGVWTLNSEDEIRSAIDMGADSYFTDETKIAVSVEAN